MKEVLLHVGMDKTGSSSIQQSFQGYDDGTLAYAKFSSANHSLPIQFLFRDPERPNRAFLSLGMERDEVLVERDRRRAELAASLNSSCDRILISAEAVMGLRVGHLTELRDTLAAQSDRIQVLAYVREPMGYASSAFQQGLKSGKGGFQIPQPRYSERFGKLDDLFGAENVTLLRFDPASFPNRSVTRDFARHIGADMSRITELRSNESLSLETAAALFLFNKERQGRSFNREQAQARLLMTRYLLLADNRRLKRIERRIAKKLGPERAARRMKHVKLEKFRFAPSLIRSEIVREDIEWMEQRSGFDLMPPETGSTDTAESGVCSEEHLLDIASSAGAQLAPIVNRLKLKPADMSTLSIMDAIYELAISKSA